MQSILKMVLISFAGVFIAGWLSPPRALGQNLPHYPASFASNPPDKTPIETTESPGPAKPRGSDSERIIALEEALRIQSTQLEQLRKMLEEQQQTIQMLAGKLETTSPTSVSPGEAVASVRSENSPGGSASENHNAEVTSAAPAASQGQSVDDRLKQIEGRVTRIGPFRFSGDFRLRFDGIFRPASKAPDPPLTHLQNARARYRLRLNFDTDIDSKLSFHGQFATGPINNPLTLDQDFSAMTARHPFFLSEAWIDYHPGKSVQLQAGRLQEVFADNSRFLFDDDVRFNGFNEKYTWSLKDKPLALTSIEFRAGQYILSNPNIAVIAPGSPLANAGQIVGSTARSSNLFHQGVLFNQKFNEKWSDQFGGDIQLYRNPNQIALASTSDGLVLLVQPGIGLALSGPLPGTGTATTTPGGAIYTARSFKIARLTYRLTYSGFEHGGHMFPVNFNVQFARNAGTGLQERDAFLAAIQVGRITKRGDSAFLYVFARKGANSMISQVTDDDLGTQTGVNIRTNHFRFDYGLTNKVTLQSLFFVQNQLRNSSLGFFVPLGAFAPTMYRLQQQIAFSF
jgi:Putative porin